MEFISARHSVCSFAVKVPPRVFSPIKRRDLRIMVETAGTLGSFLLCGLGLFQLLALVVVHELLEVAAPALNPEMADVDIGIDE